MVARVRVGVCWCCNLTLVLELGATIAQVHLDNFPGCPIVLVGLQNRVLLSSLRGVPLVVYLEATEENSDDSEYLVYLFARLVLPRDRLIYRRHIYKCANERLKYIE